MVFIDAQNTYRSARRAFARDEDHFTVGQFDPMKLARLMTARGPAGSDRKLVGVRVYTGRPDSTRDPKGYGANMKQSAAWEAAGVEVVARILRYPRGTDLRPQEKGIDVALAVDFVVLATEDQYDVGIMVSLDTDLVPALEYVAIRARPTRTVEVAAWRSEAVRGRLRLAERPIFCHFLTLDDYHQVSDTTDYTR